MLFVRFIVMGILALLATFATPSTAMAQQTRVFVNLSSTNTAPPSTTNPGDTWLAAYKHLSTGIARANTLSLASGSFIEVWVCAGTYYPDEGHDALGNPLTAGDRNLTFQLNTSVGLYGGFLGTEPASPTGFRQRDPANTTILSGDLSANDNINNPATLTDNSYHVVTGVKVNATAILDGFTITSGNAVGAPLPNPNPGGLASGEVGGGLLLLGGISGLG